MFGFNFGGVKVDSRNVELILLVVELILHEARICRFWLLLLIFCLELYCSIHFYMNLSNHKSFYLQLTFSQTQFYKSINSKSICVTAKPNIHICYKRL